MTVYFLIASKPVGFTSRRGGHLWYPSESGHPWLGDAYLLSAV